MRTHQGLRALVGPLGDPWRLRESFGIFSIFSEPRKGSADSLGPKVEVITLLVHWGGRGEAGLERKEIRLGMNQG